MADQEYLEALRNRPLALIICSQTFDGKARFVNELLNENLLPESPIITRTDVVRMIRIKVEVRYSYRVFKQIFSICFFFRLESSDYRCQFIYFGFI